ncbi:hypothetical protein W97_06941 [Coniosporium apollinis CBS 100218]|uniref:Myb-like domain-containing protein n=1 Tax=Coniosporium apollinis (strain CBS 100218) TaxID=1168221 RepID=R7Z0G8_CONA1|nr:uncharacterized protein W97_06941 [Coniosporium apollinis CBS 100218]EON67573.1 hypothetical protein W97_06941 [Coniosporium apollinis CBS 100218]
MAPKATYFSAADDALLIDLKETKKLSWKDIKSHFPKRTKGTLQVRYCRTLQHDRKERMAAFAHAKKPDVTNGTAQMKAAYRVTKTVSPPTNRDHLKRAVKNKIKFDQLLSDADTVTDAGATEEKAAKVDEVDEVHDAEATGFKIIDTPAETDNAEKKVTVTEATTPKKITDKNGNTGVITRSAGASKAVVTSKTPAVLQPKVTQSKVTKKTTTKSKVTKKKTTKAKASKAKSTPATKATVTPTKATKATNSSIPSNTPLTDAALMQLLEPPAHHTAADPLLVTPRMGKTLRDRLTKAERLANAAGNAVFSPDGTVSHPRKDEARRVAEAARKALVASAQKAATGNGGNAGKFSNWIPHPPLNASAHPSGADIPYQFTNPAPYQLIEYNTVSASFRVRRRLHSEYDTPMNALRGLVNFAVASDARVAPVARMLSPAQEAVVRTTVVVAERPSPIPEPLTPFLAEGAGGEARE